MTSAQSRAEIQDTIDLYKFTVDPKDVNKVAQHAQQYMRRREEYYEFLRKSGYIDVFLRDLDQLEQTDEFWHLARYVHYLYH